MKRHYCVKNIGHEIQAADMTFQEKSVLASLVFPLLLFGYYFIQVFQIIMEGSSDEVVTLPLLMIRCRDHAHHR